MERENAIREKSYKFSLRIVKLYKFLVENKKEYVLSKQVLRSGTSIGANIEEAVGSSSKKDFVNKLYIAHKEAREINYWIRLLKDSEYLPEKLAESFIYDCNEILKISGKIISTSKKSI
ncbi:MAG TPA: four helix bundle protein [Ignavibacteria bacterium]|nr:four helix bundle protein [Ignavibacteria bacterium]